MRFKFDVVIIGAGPGGGLAACRLAQSGLKIAILEKSTLPRHKPCGGGMPESVKDLFDWDISPLIERQICRRKTLYNYQEPRIGQAAPILMVNRSRFDHHLIQRAIETGHGDVQLREGFRVVNVEETQQGITIRGDRGEEIEADFLIGADGAFSKTASCLGLDHGRSCHGAALDAEVEVSAAVYEAECDTATFNFFCIPKGYGWIFPKDGLLSCGVGAWRGTPRLPEELRKFLEKSLPNGSIRSVKRFGHPIPLHVGRRRIATRRVCLVGDAASLVDPIMGEGIRFALKSGALAAEVIAGLTGAAVPLSSGQDVPRWGEGDCRLYQDRIHAGVGKNFDVLHQIAAEIFCEAPEYFYRQFVSGSQSYFRLSEHLVTTLRAAMQARQQEMGRQRA